MRSACLAVVLLLAPVAVHAQGALDRMKTAEDDRLLNQHYKNGWDQLKAEKWDEAVQEFQAAVDIRPSYKLAYYGLGRANMGRKRFSDAIRAYEHCRDLFEQQASNNLTNAADAERLIQDDLNAIDMTISRLQSGPQTAQTSALILQAQAQKDRLKERTGNSKNMSLVSPAPAFVWLALGSAYFRSERMADAEQAYKKAIESEPKYGEAHNNLAALYLMTGRYEDASKEAKAAEKSGFTVNPAMKQEIEAKRKGGS